MQTIHSTKVKLEYTNWLRVSKDEWGQQEEDEVLWYFAQSIMHPIHVLMDPLGFFFFLIELFGEDKV